MPIRFDRQKLRETRQTSWLALDLFMVVLVIINLAFIIFDTLYASAAVQSLIESVSPAFNQFYGEQIHEHFLFYDLIFVSIFLAEFCFQWFMAARKGTYPRWYFYPFMRWYDLISLVPVGSLRLLRLLRVVSLLIRLQKMGILDLTDTRVYQFFRFYYHVFIDEISDKVLLRTLDDVRREVEEETPITRQIITEVIAPQREALVEHLTRRIAVIAQRSYEQQEEAIREYVESVVADAVRANAGIRSLERVPLLGRPVVNTLRQSINNIACEVFDRAARDLSDAESNRLVDELVTVIIDAILEDQPELGNLGTAMTLEAIELVKDRVRVQHWKESLRRRQEEQARMK